MLSLRHLFGAFVLLLFASGCDDPSPDASDEAASDASSWSYEGQTGPQRWAALSDDYAACDGSQQSPIDLADAGEPTNGMTLKTSYTTASGEVVDTGHALQVNTTGGTLTLDGTTYELLQFHAHAPSEHTVDGADYAAEIHLVHRAEDQQLAVLGIFVEEGPEAHPALDGWIQGRDTTLSVNAGRLLPDRQSYYTYEGSLTTPPCSEIVRWVVMDQPIQASAEQLETLRAQHEGNDRPVQPLNDRQLVYVGP
jgi:carbonic anhydrase